MSLSMYVCMRVYKCVYTNSNVAFTLNQGMWVRVLNSCNGSGGLSFIFFPANELSSREDALEGLPVYSV